MARINDIFPSKYLSAGDLAGKQVVVTILGGECVRIEGKDGEAEETKWIVHTDQFDKGWMLNLTNARVIADVHGEDTDEWIDEQVVIYPTQTSFQGKTVECIRVDKKATQDLLRRRLKETRPSSRGREPAPTARPGKPEPMTQAEADADDAMDDIPY